MKSILERLRENMVNECWGGGFGSGYGCGGGVGLSTQDLRRQYHKAMKKTTPQAVIDEITELRKELKKESKKYDDADRKAYEISRQLDELEKTTYGIKGAIPLIDNFLKVNRTVSYTFTATRDVLKTLAYILSDEYDEYGGIEPRMANALSKMKEMF